MGCCTSRATDGGSRALPARARWRAEPAAFEHCRRNRRPPRAGSTETRWTLRFAIGVSRRSDPGPGGGRGLDRQTAEPAQRARRCVQRATPGGPSCRRRATRGDEPIHRASTAVPPPAAQGTGVPGLPDLCASRLVEASVESAAQRVVLGTLGVSRGRAPPAPHHRCIAFDA